jgi:hypothetical protein
MSRVYRLGKSNTILIIFQIIFQTSTIEALTVASEIGFRFEHFENLNQSHTTKTLAAHPCTHAPHTLQCSITCRQAMSIADYYSSLDDLETAETERIFGCGLERLRRLEDSPQSAQKKAKGLSAICETSSSTRRQQTVRLLPPLGTGGYRTI